VKSAQLVKLEYKDTDTKVILKRSDLGEKLTNIATVPTDWFSITDTYAARCPVTKCEALNYDTGTSTCLATKSTDFTIDTTTNAPTHALNVIPGFTKTFCYKCSNKDDSKTTKLTFTQESKCKYMLALNTTDENHGKPEYFNMTMNTTKEFTWIKIDHYDLLDAVNSDKVNCPLKTC